VTILMPAIRLNNSPDIRGVVALLALDEIKDATALHFLVTSNALTPFRPIVINIGLPSSAPVVTEQNAVPETKFVSQTKSPSKFAFPKIIKREALRNRSVC
jgi:hypothetical protein